MKQYSLIYRLALVITLFVLCTDLSAQKKKEMETKSMIKETVLDVFIGTDEREWSRVENAFADKVLLDYTSMAGGEPAKLTPKQITTGWKGVLPGFEHTQHQISNFTINVNGSEADVFCYGTATHYLEQPDGNSVWTAVGTYDVHLTQQGGIWKVDRFKFNFKYQDGNTKLPGLAQERAKSK